MSGGLLLYTAGITSRAWEAQLIALRGIASCILHLASSLHGHISQQKPKGLIVRSSTVCCYCVAFIRRSPFSVAHTPLGWHSRLIFSFAVLLKY